MYNVFEDVGDRRMRTVCQIKSRMLDFGALGSIMTGTGSAVFGIFSDRGAAQAAARSLEKDYKFALKQRTSVHTPPVHKSMDGVILWKNGFGFGRRRRSSASA